MLDFEIRKSKDPFLFLDRWDIYIYGHWWTSTHAKWMARRLIRKHWGWKP